MRASLWAAEMDIRDYLAYEPETGIFRWKVARSAKAQKGSIAGTVTSKGYIHIYFNKSVYKAHRLAFFFMEGEELPRNIEVDHVNGNKRHNAFKNLRRCSRHENQQNLPLYKNNKLGIPGVTRYGKRFRGKIIKNRKVVWSEIFDTAEEAGAAREAAKRVHHPYYEGF